MDGSGNSRDEMRIMGCDARKQNEEEAGIKWEWMMCNHTAGIPECCAGIEITFTSFLPLKLLGEYHGYSDESGHEARKICIMKGDRLQN